ncbi:MAG: MFS transporter [Chloroflexota bacterium]|nr:MFS transporter [Chloroflexota bacterium]
MSIGGRRSVVPRSMPFYFTVGLLLAMPGPSLEAVRADFNLTYLLVVLTLIVPSISYASGTIMGGLVADRLGRRFTLTTGVTLLVIGLLTSGVSPALGVLLIGTCLNGFGFGLTEAPLTATISDVAGDATGRAMTISQMPFGFGALTAPPLVGALLQTPIGWRGGYLAAALLVMLAAVVLLSARIPATTARRAVGDSLGSAVMRPVPILLGMVIIGYFSMQLGLGGFLAAYLEADHGFSRPAAATLVAAFWLGISLGRIIGAWLALRVQAYDLALGSAGLSLICAIVVAAVPQPAAILAAAVLAGLVAGPAFTTVVGLGVRYRPSAAGMIAGFMLAMGGMDSRGSRCWLAPLRTRCPCVRRWRSCRSRLALPFAFCCSRAGCTRPSCEVDGDQVVGRWARIMILAASMWFYAAGGAAISVFGPSVESIVEDFGLTYSQISLIISIISFGFIAGSLAGGAASDRWGRRAVLVPSAAGAALSMSWFAASPTFGSLLAAGFLIGATFGPGLAAATALIADLARERSTRALNLFNTAFALGAIVAPALVAVCLAAFTSWRVAYVVVAVWFASSSLFFIRLPYPPRGSAVPPFRSMVRGLTSPVSVLLGLVLMLYVGVEIAFGDFGAAFMERTQGIPRAAAAASVTAFWTGVLLGRLIVYRLAGSWRASNIVRWSLVLALGMSGLAALADSAPLAVLGFALTGATVGGVFPTALGIGLRVRPEIAGSLAGGLAAMASVGGVLLAPLIGAASDAAGPRGGMLLAPAFILVAMVLFEVVQALQRRDARDPAGHAPPPVKGPMDA